MTPQHVCKFAGNGQVMTAENDCPNGDHSKLERTYIYADMLANQAATLHQAVQLVRENQSRHDSNELNWPQTFDQIEHELCALTTDQLALDRLIAERVQQAVLKEAEWWASRFTPGQVERERLAAHRAAAGAPEEKKQ